VFILAATTVAPIAVIESVAFSIAAGEVPLKLDESEAAIVKSYSVVCWGVSACVEATFLVSVATFAETSEIATFLSRAVLASVAEFAVIVREDDASSRRLVSVQVHVVAEPCAMYVFVDDVQICNLANESRSSSKPSLPSSRVALRVGRQLPGFNMDAL
jgi:hypothetical protein